MDYHREIILVLDFGSQYTQLIARRIRELNTYSEVLPFDETIDRILSFEPKGIVLSGGPKSVLDDDAPMCDRRIFSLGIPILGICYGAQLIAKEFGGVVERSKKREYGRAILAIRKRDPLLEGFEDGDVVWMSHEDRIVKLPEGFEVLANSEHSPYAVIKKKGERIYGIQFHPEVHHTEKGRHLLKNFLSFLCGCKGLFTPSSFVEETIRRLREEIGEERVICALSGGVDSSVTAALLHRAVQTNLFCVFVNNGLLRKGEEREVLHLFRDTIKVNLSYVDASSRFLNALKGVKDPERKRKIIGRTFVRVFEEEANRVGRIRFLAQGTLYPDLIESRSYKGPSARIKSHHNVGGLPKRMRFRLVEPLKELFKDEVRRVGKELGLPDYILKRQPFPGPGLAVRIIGEVTRERLELLRDADAIVREEIERDGSFSRIWQSFAILLPIKTVGVMGDERTYEHVIALRIVESEDGMTADWARLPYERLDRVARRIINEVKGVNRVVYDISSKPPSTIEWE